MSKTSPFHALQRYKGKNSIYIITNFLLVYKWQWINFLLLFFQKIITFERSKKTKKMTSVKLVLDQLYQLMVFETPFDHFF